MEEVIEKDVCIIGGGISGLSLAHFLKDIGKSVYLIEKENSLGGVLQSESKNSYLLEKGPQTFMLEPEVKILLEELDLIDQVIIPQKNIKKRYIGNLKSDDKNQSKKTLIPVPGSIREFLFTNLISFNSKIKIIRELFGHFEKNECKDLSIYQLIEVRFGKEIAEGVASAAFIGVWASSIKNLGVKEISPAFYKACTEGTSIIKETLKESKEKKKYSGKYQIATLKNGFGSLTTAISEKLTPENYCLSSEVDEIFYNDGWNIKYLNNGNSHSVSSKSLVLATPSYGMSSVLSKIKTQTDINPILNLIDEITYSPVGIVHLAVPEEDLYFELDGFGFLIPEGRSEILLGCIFTGSLFPKRNQKGKILLTCFAGGSLYPEMTEVDKPENQNVLLNELMKLLKLKNKPEIISTTKWQNAIPQYKPGHNEILNKLKKELSKFPNLYLASNIDKGVSIPACIKNSLKLSSQISLNQ